MGGWGQERTPFNPLGPVPPYRPRLRRAGTSLPAPPAQGRYLPTGPSITPQPRSAPLIPDADLIPLVPQAPASPTASEVDTARDYTALFRIVKRVVDQHTKKSRAGMMLALGHLGLSPQGFMGGYFVVGSNAIVLNRDVLAYVNANQPESLNAYAFHVLLHEYLHTIGYLREDEVRPLAFEISERFLGRDHPSTRIAAAMAGVEGASTPAFFRDLVFPEVGFAPRQDVPYEIVKGFDPDASPYIA